MKTTNVQQNNTLHIYVGARVAEQGRSMHFLQKCIPALLAVLFGFCFFLTFTPEADAAIAAGGGTCTAQNRAAGTSLACTVATQNIEAGNYAVMIFGADNIDTTDTTNNLLSSVTDSGGNTWTVHRCFTNGQAGAAAGATSCIASSKLTTQLTSGAGTITANFTSITAKAFQVREFTVGAGNILSVAGTIQTSATDAADPNSLTVSGLTSAPYLFVRSTALERASGGTWTVTTNFTTYHTTTGCNGSTGGAAGTDISSCGEYRIVTTTSQASDPTATAVDGASVYLALIEAVPYTGTLYSDEGVTPITTGKTIKVAIGTTTTPTLYSATTNASGAWTVAPSFTGVVAGTPIVVWVDGDPSTKATLVTTAAGSATITGLNLYKDRVIVRNEDAGAVTIADMAKYDSSNDEDIQYSASTVLDALSLNEGQKLYVWSGDSFDGASTTIIKGNIYNGGTLDFSDGTTNLPTDTTVSGSSVDLGNVLTGQTFSSPINNGSHDGQTWTNRTAAEANAWNAITYGDGLFVAVAGGGTNRVMTSPDGITWTVRTAAQANVWEAVTYGKGLFVAVASSGTNRVMTSPDGITWTVRTAAQANTWESVVFGNNIFVAVSQDGTNRVMTSPDGITWTVRTAAQANTWRDVTFGNGLFVAISDAGTNRVMTSPDGITWTVRTAAEANSWLAVTYGNGLFVAVAWSGTNRVMTSPDGITWTARAASEVNSWREVTYGNGLYVAVSSDGSNKVMTSSNGFTWTARSASQSNQWVSTVYGDGRFVAVSIDGTNRVMTSESGITVVDPNFNNDGITWTARAAAEANTWLSVTYGNGLFVAVADSGTNRVMTSQDGITWTARSVQASGWLSVTYGNGLFVAVAYSGTNLVMTSPDGITWTVRTAAAANTWSAVTYGNGLFVAVACGIGATCNATAGGSRVMTSPDGITWTGRTATEANYWNSVTYANGLFVAVACGVAGTSCNTTAGGNRVMTSPDGITWTARSATEANSWMSVIYANGLFVAVSANGTNRVMTSPDGITWTARTAAAANSWQQVIYGNNLFAAVSSDGTNRVMTSPDGITWTARSASEANTWRGLTYSNGLFVGVSTNGTNRVMTSQSGTFSNSTQSLYAPTTVDNLTISASSTLVAPLSLTINGDYANAGVFTAGDGEVIIDVDTGTVGYDLAGAVYDSVAKTDVGETGGSGLHFRSDGLKMYTYGFNTDLVREFTLSSAWDLSSASQVATYSAVAQDTWQGDVTFNDTGTKMYLTGDSSDVVYEYALSTPWSITSGVTYTDSFSVAAQDGSPFGVEFSSDGTKMYVVGDQRNAIYTYTLSTPWDASTGSYLRTYSVVAQDALPNGMQFSTDGTVLFVTGMTNSSVYKYTLATPWEVSTSSIAYTGHSVSLTPRSEFQPVQVGFKADGTKMYVYGFDTADIFQYTTGVAGSGTPDTDKIFSGNMTDTSAFNDLSIIAEESVITFDNDVTATGAFSVNQFNATVTAPAILTAGSVELQGGFEHNDGTVYLNGENGTISGLLTGANALNILVASSSDFNNNGATWTVRSASEANEWLSVTYGNGTFVAVAQTGTSRVMTSPDGITWTARAAAEASAWQSVTYGNGLFVAVANAGTNRVMTSQDGITWTARSASEANEWRSVTYGNGTFVAVAVTGTNRVMTSPNGTTWTARAAAEANSWLSVTYGNGLFVAVTTAGTNRVMTSPDGITWTARAAAEANSWYGVTYGNGLFVAVASDGTNRVMTSPNGTTWTARSAAEANLWRSVTYGNGTFVAVAVTGTNRVMTSPDGITWTARAAAEANSWLSVTYGKDLFVAIGSTGTNRVMTSSSGTYGESTLTMINNASTTDLSIDGTLTNVIAPDVLSVSDDYSNNGVFTAGEGAVHFNGGVFQTLNGTMTGTSSFNTVVFSGESLKSFNDNATTGDFTIADGTTVGAPAELTIGGNYSNQGTFDSNGGHVIIQGTTTASTTGTASWDITTAVYDGAAFSVTTEETQVTSLAFSTDGTRMYINGYGGDAVKSYTLSTPWLVTSAVYDSLSFSTAGQDAFTEKIAFKDDGTKMYVLGSGNDRVFQYTLSTPWNVSTASYDSVSALVNQDASPFGMHIKADGTRLFIAGNTNDRIYSYTLSTPWVMSSATYDNKSFLVSGQETGVQDVSISEDGTKMYTIGYQADTINQYTLSTPWDVTTAVHFGSKSITAQETTPDGLEFMVGGEKMFVHGETASDIFPYSIDSDLTSIYVGTTTLAGAMTGTSAFNNLTLDAPQRFVPDGVTWVARTAAEANTWVNITYGNGLFVAVSYSGTNRVMTSPDGITWTARTAPSSSWNSVTYGNGTFVAVGTSAVMSSPDGITWTARTASQANDWNGVTYGNGLFVAVSIAGTNRVMTSPDGITWTNRTAAAANTWQNVTYGEGLFVAVSSDGTNKVMTSPDGITWTSRTTVGTAWYGIAYGNGIFVATAFDNVMTSEDGITWTQRTNYPAYSWQSVGFGDGLFVAVADGTAAFMTSTDGIDWVERTASAANQWWDVAYGNNTFVAVSKTGTNRVNTSVTGDTYGVVMFQGQASTTDFTITEDTYVNYDTSVLSIAGDYTNSGTIYWGNGTTTLSGNEQSLSGNMTGTSAFPTLVISAEEGSTVAGGITWTARAASEANEWNSVTYGNGLFVAVSDNGTNRVMTSPDGITWTAQTAAEANLWRTVTYGNGLFVAVAGSGTTRVMTSPDGITWTGRTAAEATTWTSVTYGEGLFVAVADTGTNRVMTSPDGITWTGRTASEATSWKSVTYGNGLFAAIAQGGTNRVMTSPDGITWTGRSVAASTWVAITYGNGLFVGVGSNAVTTSPDGITWTARTAAEANVWRNVTYADGLFVAVSSDGTNRVMTSPDGITWTARAASEANEWYGVAYGDGQFVAVGITGTNRVMTSDSGARQFGTIRFEDAVYANKLVSVTPGVYVEFPVYATSTFVTLELDGASGNETILRSSRDGSQWGLEVDTVVSVTYVDVSDSNACSGNPDIVATDTTDSGNNDCWDITAPAVGSAGISSAANQIFGVGQATTSISAITITDSSTPTITAASDLRIAINDLDMSWNTNDTSAFIGGTASGKVSATVSYENNGKVLVVPVNTNFAASDTLSISGLGFSQFSSLSTATTSLSLVTNGAVQSAGITWTARSAAESTFWNSVTYGNGLFVAVSYGGTNRVMTSPDGITWTGRSASAANLWVSVTYGNGLFVAVSEDGTNRVMTSPDGITWTARSAAAANTWKAVTYGNGLFVAVACGVTSTTCNATAGGSRVMTSPDGITWTGRTASEANQWKAVTYGNGLFVAVSDNGTNRVMTSPDGITWTARSASEATNWLGITYGEGTFVAVAGNGTNRVMTSTNGTNWTGRAAVDANWGSVTYANGDFVAVAYNSAGNRVMTSPDGTTWTARSASEANAWTSVAYGEGKLVAVAESGTNRVMTSTLGSTNALRDTKTIGIHGLLTLSNHSSGQVTNAFSYQNQTEAELFSYRLVPNGESANFASTVFTLSGVRRIDSSNLSNIKLYRDNNSNKVKDAADTQIGGTGTLAITGQSGTITFGTAWSATTTKDYVLIADVADIKPNEYMTVALLPGGTITGATTAGAITYYGSASPAQHIRGGGASGGTAEIGGSAPAGAGTVGGGSSGGGGGVGEEDNGQQIGSEPGFKAPTVTGELYNEWTTGGNALSSDGAYATAASTNLRQSYSVFGFNVPNGNRVDGIEVKLEASGSTAAGTIQVALSWNGDSTVTTAKATSVLTGTDAVYTLGGPSDTWGRSWSAGEFSNANFFVRVIGQPNQNTVRVDAIQVRPYHATTGGGGGGGGEI